MFVILQVPKPKIERRFSTHCWRIAPLLERVTWCWIGVRWLQIKSVLLAMIDHSSTDLTWELRNALPLTSVAVWRIRIKLGQACTDWNGTKLQCRLVETLKSTTSRTDLISTEMNWHDSERTKSQSCVQGSDWLTQPRSMHTLQHAVSKNQYSPV